MRCGAVITYATCAPAARPPQRSQRRYADPTFAYADAFATGLLAAGDAGLDAVQHAGYESLIVVRADGSIANTNGFPFLNESEPSNAARRTASAPR